MRKIRKKSLQFAILVKEKRSKLRGHISYQITPEVRFADRVELAFYKKEMEDYKGFILFHDVAYQSSRYPLTFTARYILFDVDNYDARIYAYENDVLYAFSNAMFQNRGFRFYLNAKWNISEHFTLWAKYSLTKYRNKDTIGSGLDLLNSNKLQDLKLQLRWRF